MPTAYSAGTGARRSAVPALICLAGLVAATLSGCDAESGSVLSSRDSAGSPGSARQVTVVGTGSVQGIPDALTTDVNIEFIAPDVSTAMNLTGERQQELINALVDAGVERSDIKTTAVSLQPQYSSDTSGTATISGYRASNSISIKIREVDSASTALALIVSTGGDATRINGVRLSIDNDSQLVRDARARAFDDARARAEQYAELSGLKLGKVISIAEAIGDTGPPAAVPMPRSAMAAPVPIEPGEQTVSFSVTAVWQLS